MKKVLKVFVVVMALIISQTVVSEASESSEVVVSYSPSEDALASLVVEVEIKGEGQLLDNGINVKNHTRYELKDNDLKLFQVKALTGNHLKSVVYDGKDITSDVKDSMISITCLDHDTKLIVTFEKDKGSNGTGEENGNHEESDKDDVNTGTTTMHIGFYVTLMVIAGVVIAIVYKRRKTQGGGDSNAGI